MGHTGALLGLGVGGVLVGLWNGSTHVLLGGEANLQFGTVA